MLQERMLEGLLKRLRNHGYTIYSLYSTKQYINEERTKWGCVYYIKLSNGLEIKFDPGEEWDEGFIFHNIVVKGNSLLIFILQTQLELMYYECSSKELITGEQGHFRVLQHHKNKVK